MNKIIVYRISTLIFIFISAVFIVRAQDNGIKKFVDSQTYKFVPQRANPLGGRSIDLTGGFDLVITPKKIEAYLPYYGRAYSAPVNPSDGGIKFTSISFEYSIEKGKKDSWEVTIKPQDANGVRLLQLNFYDNGFATLQVTSDQRQSISFDGYIGEYKKPKRKKRPNNNSSL